ncbi:MAG: hypothetical protein AAGF71_08780, partial [Pseudomonadota bacterium]
MWLLFLKFQFVGEIKSETGAAMDVFKQSPTDEDFVQDPYPAYEAMRTCGEVVFWQDYGMAAAVSHAAVQNILRSKSFARVPPPGFEVPLAWDGLPSFAALEDASMLSNEAPRHTALRRSVLTAFTSARVEALTPWIEGLCRELLDRFPSHGEPFDLLEAYATPIPVLTIAHMLGQPAQMAGDLLAWSHAMVRLYTSNPSDTDRTLAETASAAFMSHLKSSFSELQPSRSGTLAQALLVEHREGCL